MAGARRQRHSGGSERQRANAVAAPIATALLLNEVRRQLFRRSLQTVIYLPHFLSWVIMAGILIDVLSPTTGVVNAFLHGLGLPKVFFLGNRNWFPYVLVATDVWKEFGFGTIVYLAALTGISPAGEIPHFLTPAFRRFAAKGGTDMVCRRTWGSRLFHAANGALLLVLAIVCLLPLVSVLAVSFSSAAAIESGRATLVPVEFTLRSYGYVEAKKKFLASMGVAAKRVSLGVVVNMLVVVVTAYPLSKERERFRPRTEYAWILVFTILFSGGLIPTYIVVRKLGLLDSLWALVLLLNFFRGQPKELQESAFIDGAGHWQTLWRIAVPLAAPAIAELTLFTIVGHWNEWFAGLIYMNDPAHYPLASYLQTIVVRLDMTQINDPS